MIYIYLYRMPNDISEYFNMNILSGLIETLDAIKNEDKIVLTYQTCIDTLMRYSKDKRITVFLADGEKIEINNKNKMNCNAVLKRNKDSAIIVKQNVDLTDDDKCKLECIMSSKSYINTHVIDSNLDKISEDVVEAIKNNEEETKKEELVTELDVINKISLDNNLGKIVSIDFEREREMIYSNGDDPRVFIDGQLQEKEVNYTIENGVLKVFPEFLIEKKELTSDKDLIAFTKMLNSIKLPNKTIDMHEIDFNKTMNIKYCINFDSGYATLRKNCEFNIVIVKK